MSILTVANAARALLEPLGYPVHHGDELATDERGLLKVPDDPAQFILHVITREPYHEWGGTRYGTVTIQVNAFSRVEGEALAMLAAAEPLLVAGRFTPGRSRGMPRDGPYTGHAQDFERNA
jgi:hypothetical protein